MKKPSISFDFLDPVFQNFEKLTKVQRIATYTGTFVVLIGAFAFLSFMPKFNSISDLKSELEEEQNKLATAQRTAMQLNMWRGRKKAATTRLNEVARKLPERQEIPSLLTSISRSGQDAGLEFLLFQPKPEIARGFYAEIPLSLKVVGNYHAVAIFFDMVSRLSRIVNIKDINMTTSEKSESLETTCTAVTYKFIEALPDKK